MSERIELPSGAYLKSESTGGEHQDYKLCLHGDIVLGFIKLNPFDARRFSYAMNANSARVQVLAKALAKCGYEIEQTIKHQSMHMQALHECVLEARDALAEAGVTKEGE